mmetsp:Transcript_5218/g.14956  ORF Transcript_5218/g.14956 Transcript_5218/m.14956 type:complete len:281 (+) Transcript_5218:394-1236(+)
MSAAANPASFNVQMGGGVDTAAPGANAQVPAKPHMTAEEQAHLAKWSRRARNFIIITIVFSFVSGVLAVAASILTDSAALLAYGLESFVDLGASVLVVWRFWDNTDEVEGLRANLQREERANVGIAATFIAIAIITGGDAISHLVRHTAPDDSVVILAFAVVSIVVLGSFGCYKLYINQYVTSKALEQDAVASFSVVVLSIGILITAALYQVNEGVWWLDAVIALAVTIGIALYSIPILVTRPWWRREFWKPWERRGSMQPQQLGERLRTQPDSSMQDVV